MIGLTINTDYINVLVNVLSVELHHVRVTKSLRVCNDVELPYVNNLSTSSPSDSIDERLVFEKATTNKKSMELNFWN